MKKERGLSFPLKGKYIAMVAPSFVTDFSYPQIIVMLKKLGFDKVVELTFGAKIVNREYHKKLKTSKKMLIATACPGVVSLVENNFPQYKNNLIKVDSPMIAMGKVVRKYYPQHKSVFISPCDFKKIEASKSKYVDYVVDYEELKEIFKQNKIKKPLFCKNVKFDSFYNDYTKIYPLSGALAKTAKVKNILNEDEFVSIDGAKKIVNFLKNPDEKIKFIDCLFCEGGCVGGPHTNKKISLDKKISKINNYLKCAKREDIPEDRKGIFKKVQGIKFSS